MATTAPLKNRLIALKKEYDNLKKGKEALLVIIDEAEISESVYNSNAIENSTLTLKETEKILMKMEISRNISLREVYEAKNLASVSEYVRNTCKKKELDKETILFLHKMLINTIDDSIAGRFRIQHEYVRVGTHIAPPPEHTEKLIESIIDNYLNDFDSFFIDKTAKFHLAFENIHPFCDGNGRIGRVIINYQLQRLSFPVIIIRNKDKKHYYNAFAEYDDDKNTKSMEKIIVLALMESLHKRITYLKGKLIITLSEYVKKLHKNAPGIFNAAHRQTIPAFREKGVWKIGV